MVRNQWIDDFFDQFMEPVQPSGKSLIRFKGKFQEAYTKSWPGRMYSQEMFERLMNDEQS